MPEESKKAEDKAADKLAAEEKELRRIADEDLATILEAHRKWIEANKNDGSQADLTRVDLSYQDLSMKTLQDAILTDASFEHADLVETNLEGAFLVRARLADALLYKADLSGAYLNNVTGLETARLEYCVMDGAVGLKGDEFARGDITGARLPEKIRDFKGLETVAEISRNARKIFVAMLLACVYCWLTIGQTTDVNLITNSASSPLPIIQTPIPIASFYKVAPFILLGLYLYLHFYLQRLWKALAGLPAIFEDGKSLDERAYPWLLNGLVRRHFEKLRDERTLINRAEELVSIFLAWWVMPITLGWFWLRFIPRHDWTGTILQITLLVVSAAEGIIFYQSHVELLRGDQSRPDVVSKKRRNGFRTLYVVPIGLLLFFLSKGAIDGRRTFDDFGRAQDYSAIPQVFKWLGYDVFTDFRETDVSRKPADYWSVDSEVRDSSVAGAALMAADLRFADATWAFLVNANLRFADLSGASLPWVYLRGADLYGAILQRAQMMKADLEGADLREADLSFANLQGVDLRGANLRGASLSGATLQGANLQGADLTDVEGLTQEQLDKACGDSTTILPPGLTITPCPD